MSPIVTIECTHVHAHVHVSVLPWQGHCVYSTLPILTNSRADWERRERCDHTSHTPSTGLAQTEIAGGKMIVHVAVRHQYKKVVKHAQFLLVSGGCWHKILQFCRRTRLALTHLKRERTFPPSISDRQSEIYLEPLLWGWEGFIGGLVPQ